MTLLELKEQGKAPEWMNEESLHTLQKGYLLPDETPYDMYKRIAKAADKGLGYPGLSGQFFDLMWSNWLCPSTPVASNMGTERGLPISCLTDDAWINTFDGGKHIKDINVGDLVLTHEGRWRPVTHIQNRMSSGDLYQIKISTRKTPIRITGNHPVLTNLGWVRVDQLTESHLVATNCDIEIPEKEHTVDFTKYIKYETIEKDGRLYKKSTNKKVRKQPKDGIVSYYSAPYKNVNITDDVAWALGLWVAEGSRSINNKKIANGIRITLHKDEIHFAKKFIEVMKGSFGFNGSFYESSVIRNGKTNSWLSVNVNGDSLGAFFDTEFGIGAKTKTIPEWIVNLPKDKLTHFLQGVIDGDGSTKKGGLVRITLSNPKLITSLYHMALKLGLNVSLQMQEKPGRLATTKFVYSLYLLKGFKSSCSPHRADSGIKFGKLRYCPIRELKKLDKDERVWDLTVEEDHSFSVAGVVVHNCYGSFVEDSVDGIFNFYHEAAMLTKNGGGIGSYWSSVRGRGASIKGNGQSEGVVPWLAILDRTALAVGQGGVRRAGIQATLDIDHGDFEEFLQIRKPLGDVNRQCLNLHQAINVSDDFMKSLTDGNQVNRNKWVELLKMRSETGEPYIMFSDTANRTAPKQFQGKQIYGTQLCSEIFLPNDKDHTYVCCLSSMNLARYEEWSGWKCVKTGLTAIELSIYFLDGVMQEFIDKAKNLPGFEKAVRFSEKSRALGLGVLGYHSLLQDRGFAFDSFDSMMLNAKIFKQLEVESESATTKLATLLGEPEWVKGFNRRNLTCLAIAPTMSNSIISGGMSAGIEPISSNCYSLKSAKGTFIRKNPLLVKKLEEVGQNTVDIWDLIIKSGGSVQGLSDKILSPEDKQVFKTAREINQFAIVKQAGQRQKWIDQGQSVNLFFTSDSSAKYIHDVHMMAWEEGLKSLYYLRSESVLRGHKSIEYQKSDCASCEG